MLTNTHTHTHTHTHTDASTAPQEEQLIQPPLHRLVFLPMFQTAGAVEKAIGMAAQQYQHMQKTALNHPQQQQQQQLEQQQILNSLITQNETVCVAVQEVWELLQWLLLVLLGPLHERDVRLCYSVLKMWVSECVLAQRMRLEQRSLQQVVKLVLSVVNVLHKGYERIQQECNRVLQPRQQQQQRQQQWRHVGQRGSITSPVAITASAAATAHTQQQQQQQRQQQEQQHRANLMLQIQIPNGDATAAAAAVPDDYDDVVAVANSGAGMKKSLSTNDLAVFEQVTPTNDQEQQQQQQQMLTSYTPTRMKYSLPSTKYKRLHPQLSRKVRVGANSDDVVQGVMDGVRALLMGVREMIVVEVKEGERTTTATRAATATATTTATAAAGGGGGGGGGSGDRECDSVVENDKGVRINTTAKEVADVLLLMASHEKGFCVYRRYALKQMSKFCYANYSATTAATATTTGESNAKVFISNRRRAVNLLRQLLSVRVSDTEPHSQEAKRRLSFFVNSLFMNMPKATSVMVWCILSVAVEDESCVHIHCVCLFLLLLCLTIVYAVFRSCVYTFIHLFQTMRYMLIHSH